MNDPYATVLAHTYMQKQIDSNWIITIVTLKLITFIEPKLECWCQVTICCVHFVFYSNLPASILLLLPDRSSEESFASITGSSSIMFASCPVTTNGTTDDHAIVAYQLLAVEQVSVWNKKFNC